MICVAKLVTLFSREILYYCLMLLCALYMYPKSNCVPILSITIKNSHVWNQSNQLILQKRKDPKGSPLSKKINVAKLVTLFDGKNPNITFKFLAFQVWVKLERMLWFDQSLPNCLVSLA